LGTKSTSKESTKRLVWEKLNLDFNTGWLHGYIKLTRQNIKFDKNLKVISTVAVSFSQSRTKSSTNQPIPKPKSKISIIHGNHENDIALELMLVGRL